MSIMKFILALLTALLLPVSVPLYAITVETTDGVTEKSVLGYIDDFVDIPEGGLDWKVLGTTKEITVEAKTDDGFDMLYSKPDFQPEVKSLDGQQIKIKGYMFPLDSTEDQKFFLFGPFPLSCPYHYHIGPALIVEVYADNNPVKFNYDPVTITGTLELVPEDPEYSVFYRLKDAKQVQ